MGLFDKFKKRNNETAEKKPIDVRNDEAAEKNTEIQKKAETVKNAEELIHLSEERKNEIGPIVFQQNIEKNMLCNINIQETIFLLKSIEHFNNLSSLQNFEVNRSIIYNQIIDEVKEAEIFYVLFDKATGYPFLSEGNAEIYSQHNFAEAALNHYSEIYRKLEIRAVKKKETGLPENIDLFAYLYYLGMEKIIIDNGVYSLIIDRAEILPPPDWSHAEPITIPIINPDLSYAMLDFLGEARWEVNYPDREKNVTNKENVMLNEIKNARYLIPMQTNGEEEKTGEYSVTFKQGAQLNFAMITNTDDKVFVPIFTDWIEFRKVYNQDEWNGCIFSIKDAIAIGENNEGIAINPYGENVILNKEILAKLKSELGE